MQPKRAVQVGQEIGWKAAECRPQPLHRYRTDLFGLRLRVDS